MLYRLDILPSVHLESGIFVITVYGQTFFKNVCKDVKESYGFGGRTIANVGTEAYENIIINHVSMWDHCNIENFQKLGNQGTLMRFPRLGFKNYFVTQ